MAVPVNPVTGGLGQVCHPVAAALLASPESAGLYHLITGWLRKKCHALAKCPAESSSPTRQAPSDSSPRLLSVGDKWTCL